MALDGSTASTHLGIHPQLLDMPMRVRRRWQLVADPIEANARVYVA
jgi:hypothetical protein